MFKSFIVIAVSLTLTSMPAAAAPATNAMRQGAVLARPGGDNALVGEERHIRLRAEDTLADIGLRHALGYRELSLANPGVDPWLPGEGTQVLLPGRRLLPDAPRRGIVLNLVEMRLYYFPEEDEEALWTFPVGIGREGWQTPTGATEVVRKARDPAWFPPASIQAERAALGQGALPARVPPGPNNPLGRHALYLALPGYLIHGTNQPYGIGMPVSHGCIRLHPDDIEQLFQSVRTGTPVSIVDQPVKVGWHDGVLYMEVHPPLSDGNPETNQGASALVAAIIRVTGDAFRYEIDWELAHALLQSPDGRPHPIGRVVEPFFAE